MSNGDNPKEPLAHRLRLFWWDRGRHMLITAVVVMLALIIIAYAADLFSKPPAPRRPR